MTTNRDRAERFAGVLPYYPDDEYSNTIDLLADCQHWCHEQGHDFDDLLRVARNHFTDERLEEQKAKQPDHTGQAAEKAKSLSQSQNTQGELIAALNYLLEQTVDMDLKYGIVLTEGENEAREQALAAIAHARSVT